MMRCGLRITIGLTGAAALAAAPGASAGVQVNLYADRGASEAAVGGELTTIGFTGYPATTPRF